MLRRAFPLALAGATLVPALISTGARAQGQSPATPGRAAGPGAAPQANTPPANLAGLSPAQLVLAIHQAGSFSLATARLGMEKAAKAEVKRFTNFEVTEQEGVAQAMKLAGHDLPAAEPQGEKLQTLRRLQAAEGEAFDRAFLQVQEQGHQELLNLTAAAMQGGAPVPDRITALLAHDRIREHLILIGAMMGRR